MRIKAKGGVKLNTKVRVSPRKCVSQGGAGGGGGGVRSRLLTGGGFITTMRPGAS